MPSSSYLGCSIESTSTLHILTAELRIPGQERRGCSGSCSCRYSWNFRSALMRLIKDSSPPSTRSSVSTARRRSWAETSLPGMRHSSSPAPCATVRGTMPRTLQLQEEGPAWRRGRCGLRHTQRHRDPRDVHDRRQEADAGSAALAGAAADRDGAGKNGLGCVALGRAQARRGAARDEAQQLAGALCVQRQRLWTIRIR